MFKEHFFYYLIRVFTFPIRYLPYSWIHCLGRGLGRIAYPLLRTYRKKTLSNLALAKDLNLSERELIQTAKKSFENLAITALEYARFDRETNFSRVIQCENPEIADRLYKQGIGIVFFCGHLSNWETLFLDGTSRMQGCAIGKSIKNKRLYQWILSIREKNGGKIFSQRNALKEGLRALRKGFFLGIVGDQGVPNSNHLFPFLGRMARTSTAPALLAAKTHSPLIVATTRRVKGGYRIHYSDPLWADPTQPIESEVVRLMNRALNLFQERVKQSPGEWLWQHNRWKQQTPHIVYKRFRHDSICIILPEDEPSFRELLPHLPILRKIYPIEFLILLVPIAFKNTNLIPANETIFYKDKTELFQRDYRIKLLFNFTTTPVSKYYEKFSVFETVTLPLLQQLAKPHLASSCSYTLSDLFLRALCRPNTLWKKNINFV